jgi:hypothetical protein
VLIDKSTLANRLRQFTWLHVLALVIALTFAAFVLGTVVVVAVHFNPTATPLAAIPTLTQTATVTASAAATFTPTATDSPTLAPTQPSDNKTVQSSQNVLTLTATPTQVATLTPILATTHPPTSKPCVNIASDSNGYGQVTFQIPTSDDKGVISVYQLSTLLQLQLDQQGLSSINVADRSMTAASITGAGPVSYMAGVPFKKLLEDRCRFIVIGPFLADILYENVTAEQYIEGVKQFVDRLLRDNLDRTIFVLGHYQVSISPFVAEQKIYAGFNQPERIDTFITKVADACQPQNSLGRYREVICIDTQRLFSDFGNPYLVTDTNFADYQMFHDPRRPTKFERQVDLFFQEYADGQLIGDGFHMNLAARRHLMGQIAQHIAAVEGKQADPKHVK